MMFSVDARSKDLNIYESLVQRFEEMILNESHEWQAQDVYEYAIKTAKAVRLSLLLDMKYDRATENRLRKAVRFVAKNGADNREANIVKIMESCFNLYEADVEYEKFMENMLDFGVEFYLYDVKPSRGGHVVVKTYATRQTLNGYYRSFTVCETDDCEICMDGLSTITM